jgi:LCP family protein required for cell wall assembly
MQDTRPYRRQRHAHAQRVGRVTPRVRRRANWRRRFAVVGLLLAAVVVAGLVLGWQRAVAFNDAVSTQSALSMHAFGPFSPSRVNVLLLGYNDESHGGAYLTDSINVISIDQSNDVTTMIPIPRDLWVEGIEQVPQNMKINEAFRIGYYADGLVNGASLAAEAVARVTGLRIDGWITLDFQGFEAMVDAIGGITVDNPTAFAYTWDEAQYLAGEFQFAFDAGTIRLTGQQALDYARNRYTSVPAESSDFARSARQQRVLQAIRDEVSGWQTVDKGMALADALKDHLNTDLSVMDLGMLATKLGVDRRVELREEEILQSTVNTIGQYVLVVIGQRSTTDYQPLHDYIEDQLAAPIEASSPPASPAG